MAVTRREPNTPLRGPRGEELARLSDFWTWAYAGSDADAEPRTMPHYLVELALGRTPSRRWGARPTGAAAMRQQLLDALTIEVRGASEVPSLARTGAANITFSLANRPTVDAWIFALLAHTDPSTIDPLDATQWAFFVVPDVFLELAHARSRSITLTQIAASHFGTPVPWEGLADAMAAAFETSQLGRAVASGERPAQGLSAAGGFAGATRLAGATGPTRVAGDTRATQGGAASAGSDRAPAARSGLRPPIVIQGPHATPRPRGVAAPRLRAAR